MIKKIITPILVLSLLSFKLSNEWELKKKRENIKVYTKMRENSKLYSYRASTVLAYSIQDVEKLLLDIPQFTKWVDRNTMSKVIQKDRDKTFYYSVFEAPFPVQDRDVVMRVSLSHISEKHHLIEHHSYPSKFPLQENMIRVRDTYGKWELEYVAKDQTKITYEGYSDPAGSLPAWLINTFSVDGPYNSILELRALLQEQKN